jgi:hypothetical protein
MSETRTRPALRDPMRDSYEEATSGAGSDMLPALTPRVGGAATDQALANFVTAQRVAVKRNLKEVLTEAKALGNASGNDFYYRIPFKSRNKDGEGFSTTFVEGPSIDCAMAVASCYGNCRVGATVVRETHDAWTFSATFQDLEKGVTVVREFQQRKGQNTGMKDGGRQLDIVFQIGQSKAIRNVVVAAIPTITNVAYMAAKDSILGRVEQNPEKFREWLVGTIEGMRLSLAAIESALATTYRDWSASQMARTYADLKAVKDGMVQPDDLWPGSAGGKGVVAGDTVSEAAAAAGAVQTEDAEEQPPLKPRAAAPTAKPEPAKPAAPAKPKAQPKAAPKPEPVVEAPPEEEVASAPEEEEQTGEDYGEIPPEAEPEAPAAPAGKKPVPDFNFGG